jgi:hypothetical protein
MSIDPINEVRLTGAFERGIELSRVSRGDNEFDLAAGSLTFNVTRGGKEIRNWIDVECIGEQSKELAEVPMNVAVTVTGEIRRAAWKDPVTDEWKHRHFIYYRSHVTHAVGETPVDDLPF